MKRMNLMFSIALAAAPAAAWAAGEAVWQGALMPPEAVVRDAVLTHPLVRASDAGFERDRATGERLRVGPYETQLEAGGQRRAPGADGAPEVDWSVAIARPLRLPAKREADFALGDRLAERGRMSALDARHETSRLLLAGWFDLLRQRAGAAQAARQAEVLAEIVDVVGRRIRAGDAARLEELQAQAALALADGQLQLARHRVDAARISLERNFPQLTRVAMPAIDSADTRPTPAEHERPWWVERIMSVNHEIALQRAEAGIRRAQAGRARAERTPDPSIGLRGSTDRARADRILGVFVSIPLAGGGRAAAEREALALADEGEARAAATERRVLAAALSSYEAAEAGGRAWRALADARERSEAAARVSARAFELGEGTLTDLLLARRTVLDAALAEQTARIDALEALARLRLDAHLLWDFDGD
ncbi:TolC family protein [Quisquiliibacterium transsilvanicum]|uniref:Outer membrane protein TolC n=1 Tax=Quisquiliibacterium transsilvanicum TaxID=1549638 RepID=A0A7W8M756_9BURK|nr:TolC family protein [Quisquiliibacterium transsilvanicum]MBB5270566.1 outer membrane protein TolC [Quisquiliibacterium transsilvanicum]